jgi:hypothetical protein
MSFDLQRVCVFLCSMAYSRPSSNSSRIWSSSSSDSLSSRSSRVFSIRPSCRRCFQVSACVPGALLLAIRRCQATCLATTRAAIGILFGLFGVAAFAIAYLLAARRFQWPIALALAAAAFFATSAGASRLPAGLLEAGLADYAALLMAVAFVQRPQFPVSKVPSPWWDIWFRMGAAALLTLAITATANRLGPLLSGILGTYPVVTTVVTTFTHHQLGRESAIAMMRSSILTWFGFVSCFVVIGLTLKSYGLATSLSLGALAAVGTTIAVFWIDRFAARLASAYKQDDKQSHGGTNRDSA